MQFLHCYDNSEKKTFRRGYRLGKVFSIDEGMMPNRSKYNPVRVFMSDKPSKYDTKFYVTFCAETAYLSRQVSPQLATLRTLTINRCVVMLFYIYIYCDAVNQTKKKKTTLEVMLGVGRRRLCETLRRCCSPPKRLIVPDSFDATVALSMKLLKMKLYHLCESTGLDGASFNSHNQNGPSEWHEARIELRNVVITLNL
ncbi:LOW QUALITY PROTEIN: hypothetical protein PHMEG_00019523 [Phytophthora megakarya]|uniref:PiggyBac transposable element-derived protein domain-containing protein n=1 Tax=Phytophthora megakarya TaxID=4795 RepID=A0A225VRN9_9STRA|nr:LOW QUALITY PROTEIN: hypothetical protein PHMEG_00019523 [Phytophthora megakarya]